MHGNRKFRLARPAAALLTSVVTATTCFALPPATATDHIPISSIQGPGPRSPLEDQTVTTRGVVTAVYPEGGLKGYFIQTPGTGGDRSLSRTSDGLFIYSPATVASVSVGDYVEVTGKVSEYFDQTQLTVSTADSLTVLAVPFTPVTPVQGALPENPHVRESLEGMLLQPTGDITVTDNYNTNRYGEIGLVNGTTPLRTATDVVAPGPEAYAYEAANAQKVILLDDGATIDYTRAGTGVPAPYLGLNSPLRVGAQAEFPQPLILSYSYNAWRLQPTSPVTGNTDPAQVPLSLTYTRPAPVQLTSTHSISSFNVLNYFTTLGDSVTGCKFYTDRDKNPITVSGGCSVRGAATLASFERQEAKIVEAINKIDTSVLSLEEIENPAATVQGDRDGSLKNLVTALNRAAGYTKWEYVPSPKDLPANEDVIRTAFIYQPTEVTPVGESAILDDPAFSNARQPLAQAFAPASAGPVKNTDVFVAVVNHFKSKGSGSGEDADQGDGQGASNASRVAQAQALVTFAEAQGQAHATDKIMLLGDFNAYTKEDPLQVLTNAGYTNIGEKFNAGQTYLFGGRTGSLDHILASPALTEKVESAQVWNINSVESIAHEYSRYNYNITNFYDRSEFRSSDHDPLLVGLDIQPRPFEFKDVSKHDAFYYEIMWLADRGITTGWEDGTYRPLNSIERGAMAAFFYRLAGKPEFTAPAQPSFKDVSPAHPFYHEIEWMKSRGITKGWEDGTFRPDESVTRDAMAAFFYRYAGSPHYVAPLSSQFTDVATTNMFYKEIMWMRSRGITTGWPDQTFRPVETVKRDAMAAFIYRFEILT
ncbi:ExeM/NucH family extracellular endonuclease [Rothia nasimurium]|uniref:ExeM/NucH family extracellular endonuclease n=1 Tax=Rothia nasimurium TaxID=85336 RepID=UPI001F181B37|nr:ExeM/NucH family extracellular endonuclease [Rothia nasimurium]